VSKNLLEIKNLTSAFLFDGKPVPVIFDVSYELRYGEVLGIVGESGSGKSVTAKNVMRLLPSPPASVLGGEIILDGESILEKSDLNIYVLTKSPLFRFGLSLNKSFEYFASAKPVLASANSGYSIIDRYQCGVCLDEFTPEKMAEEIVRFANMPKEEYESYCRNADRAAEDYDFKKLTDKLIKILAGE